MELFAKCCGGWKTVEVRNYFVIRKVLIRDSRNCLLLYDKSGAALNWLTLQSRANSFHRGKLRISSRRSGFVTDLKLINLTREASR